MYGDKIFAELFIFNTTESLQVYLYQTKAKVICYFIRIELIVKLVFEVKSAADFLSPYIYDYHFGPSSPITQNLAHKNGLLSWSRCSNFTNIATYLFTGLNFQSLYYTETFKFYKPVRKCKWHWGMCNVS